MANETTKPVATEAKAAARSQPRVFTAAQLRHIRRQAAQLIGVPEESLVLAEGRVIVRGDSSRVGTLLFRLVGAKAGVCLVWEDGRNKAVWLYERHAARCPTAA